MHQRLVVLVLLLLILLLVVFALGLPILRLTNSNVMNLVEIVVEIAPLLLLILRLVLDGEENGVDSTHELSSEDLLLLVALVAEHEERLHAVEPLLEVLVLTVDVVGLPELRNGEPALFVLEVLAGAEFVVVVGDVQPVHNLFFDLLIEADDEEV